MAKKDPTDSSVDRSKRNFLGYGLAGAGLALTNNTLQETSANKGYAALLSRVASFTKDYKVKKRLDAEAKKVSDGINNQTAEGIAAGVVLTGLGLATIPDTSPADVRNGSPNLSRRAFNTKMTEAASVGMAVGGLALGAAIDTGASDAYGRAGAAEEVLIPLAGAVGNPQEAMALEVAANQLRGSAQNMEAVAGAFAAAGVIAGGAMKYIDNRRAQPKKNESGKGQ